MRSTRSTRSIRRTKGAGRTGRTALCGAVCGALLLTGCTGSDRPPPSDVPSTHPPYTSRPIPAGKGSTLPDDLNGDGRPELQLHAGDKDALVPTHVAFLYGTGKGPDPKTRTILDAAGLGLPTRRVFHDEYTPRTSLTAPVKTADLDGDGYADVATTRDRTPDDTAGTGTSRTEAYISWGTPKGPRPGRRATRVRLGGHRISPESGLERGDFNGDGKHDLLASGAGRDGTADRFFVLYGPFSRAGEPARVTEHKGMREEGLYVDEIAPGRATGVVAASCHTGSKDSGLLFGAGPAGLGPPREIPAGSLPAWGDFDGDPGREVAVANDPTCDFYVEEESGPEWEPPPGAATTVKILDGTRVARTVRIPKAAAPMDAGRLDGTGPEELLIGHGDPEDEMEDPASPESLGVTLLSATRAPRALPHIPRNTTPHAIRDFDGDGREEVVFVRGALMQGAKLYVTEGTSPTDRPAFLGTVP
ncbi:FG-GAP repeat domain-containing protein [Streptomyces monticola]|uniref:FG-GAP repeat domain-containing protein n=1 Tax=Streptomyces monticola TaxID=2666263 RepID=A0ABW2JJR9_9ACTN